MAGAGLCVFGTLKDLVLLEMVSDDDIWIDCDLYFSREEGLRSSREDNPLRPPVSLHKVFLLIGPVSIKAHGDPTAYWRIEDLPSVLI